MDKAMSQSRLLMIVEDDVDFAKTLKRSFERRGYCAIVAHSPGDVQTLLLVHAPGYAVVDLKLGTSSGLACVKTLHAYDPAMRIVVLTGYASITTAVEAIKLGASNYLPKPSNTDDIERAFEGSSHHSELTPTAYTTSIKTLEWERIHQTLSDTGFNISETARRLGK